MGGMSIVWLSKGFSIFVVGVVDFLFISYRILFIFCVVLRRTVLKMNKVSCRIKKVRSTW